MKGFHRLICRAILLVVASLSGIYGFGAPQQPDSVLNTAGNGDICSADVHVRCDGKHWALLWDFVDENNYCSATVRRESANFDNEDYGFVSSVTLVRVEGGKECFRFDKLIQHQERDFSVKIGRDGAVTNIDVGDGKRLWSGVAGPIFAGFPRSRIVLRRNKPASVKTARVRFSPCVGGQSLSVADVETLSVRLAASTDSLEGIWEFMERDISNAGVKIGGFYRLAVVKDGADYEILYLDGADSYRELWNPLYVKGRMTPTRYLNHYDLEWIAAPRDVYMRGEMWVDVEAEGTVLALHFPLLKTVLKFRKV